jgi:hypothetical protein
MLAPPFAMTFWTAPRASAIAGAKTLEFGQTVGSVPRRCSHATLPQGRAGEAHKIQHPPYKKHQELRVLIVAELSFPVHFVASPSLRFTYGNHTATLADNSRPSFSAAGRGRMDAVTQDCSAHSRI